MGGGGQAPPRERATEGADRSEGAMPHRQFTIYFTTGARASCPYREWPPGLP